MALTRDFKETVQARARRDPAFCQALLQEAVAAVLEGDLATGKAILRDYINATIGFEALGRATDSHTIAEFGRSLKSEAQLRLILEHRRHI
jgi:hypothetical protein